MKKLFIKDLAVRKKKVMVRTDYNVPLDEDGNITDDTRIRATLPTINYLLDEEAKVIIASHLGRPVGANPKYSLKPVARRLQRFLTEKVKITLAEDCIGEEVKKQVEAMNYGDVLLLENLRFHPGEQKNDAGFAKELAGLCDLFVQDAFGNCHRNHASMVGIVRYVPAAAGFLIKKELDYFEKSVNDPIRPVIAILGGSKVSDKIKILENLAKKMDKIIIGGAMAFTFLKAQGIPVGKSLVEDSMIETANNLMDYTKKNGTKLYLPVDFVVAEKFDKTAETKVVPFQEIPERWIALDIGPATIKLFSAVLQDAKTILWNGPMGAFEIDAFSRGTYAMVDIVTSSHASTVVGGGDTDMAFHKAGKAHEVSFISTGGGAFLKLLEGGDLPGIASLTDKKI
ncbi:MAG: phosphoglycerate kinase [Candidatus Kuenenia stuttgartiensis]|jgi:phosphoglycerate kinase|uniref:Phosphoglycerate kinase n=1 Tax=Kuenenia stuttgartiensis TaxID=174633 RepID=Q1PZ80_KUEST|nr:MULTISPECIES: phosphoglycerate kinase [Kuenenia]MBE7547363.1 phosphoglycerate kinase [Planctomycetia bacterium]MBZ0190587.1 phosphoglycerate kinase [Candidatus Kuenenia stuttgartiensis]MCF6151822.1 phosphoglycerate kinase [Candidatus Kuenenia stuttgartiensis]MCL4726378.1 phosphoglycerate kinase [Candidatus Kuenenia stuttgartiensis]MCZ7623824.1 phosphoglycerate kinase [Candidatus Kuenenia sp.]